MKLVAITRSLDHPFSQIRQGFRNIYKDIDLTFNTILETADLLDHLRKEKADIGFTIKDIFNLFDYKGLLIIPWGIFEMEFVVGKKHHLAGKKNLGLKDLKDEKWVLFEKESWLRNSIENIFNQHKFSPKNIYETNDGVVACSMVKSGEGITFLPVWGIWDNLESGKLIPIELKKVKTDVPINIIISSTHRSKLVSAFVDYLLKRNLKGIILHSENSN